MIVMLALRHRRRGDFQNAPLGPDRDTTELWTAVRESGSASGIRSG
jgi:hypothetical protein